MRKQRQLHLWIGLVTSVLILVEAVTGLIMSEPWLVGMNQPQFQQRMQMNGQPNGQDISRGSFQPSNMSVSEGQNSEQEVIQAQPLNQVQSLAEDSQSNQGQGFNQDPQINQGQDFTQDSQFDQGQQFAQGPRGDFEGKSGGNSVMGFIKNLHAGKIGNTNIKIFADIAAIGLIILTITGIYLSVKILRVQFKNKSNLQTS